ncbi:MAG: hypothetical protein IT424_02685 [Pirellulales bacterium]|nr:hypothetical protein [Pirellulales bacterium]
MSANQFRLAALVLMFVLVAAAGTLLQNDRAEAQAPPPPAAPAVGRFQISAYATPSSEGLNPGCYIVDTASGKVWHTRLGAGLVEVTKQPLLPSP